MADAFATMLGFRDDIRVVGVVPSGAEMVDLDEQVEPDVILMDVSLQGLNGIEATREIIGRRPGARVVVLTMHNDPETVTAAMAAGALGFLPKNAGRVDLVTAVEAVARGEGYIHPTVTRTFLDRVGPLANQSPAAERLTTVSARCSSAWRAGAPPARSPTSWAPESARDGSGRCSGHLLRPQAELQE